jgi:hypothetical protein
LLVEVVDGVGNESFEAVLFDPLGDVLRKQVLLVLAVSDKVRYHG